jgi:putative ABC transport system permease protein
MLFFGIVSIDTKYHAYEELKESRTLGEWVSRVTTVESSDIIFRNVLLGQTERSSEYRLWAGFTESEFSQFSEICQRINQFDQYFNHLTLSSRSVLLSDGDSRALLFQLADSSRFAVFANLVKDLRLPLPLGSLDELGKLVHEDTKNLSTGLSRIQAGQEERSTRINQILDTLTFQQAICNESPALVGALRAEGFVFPDELADKLATQAHLELDYLSIKAALEQVTLKALVARRIGVNQTDVSSDKVLAWVSNEKKALWLNEKIAEFSPSHRFLTKERIFAVAQDLKRSRSLEKALGEEQPIKRKGIFSLPAETLLLILVSFLVCIIGISNTMLMSVTDRFSEIATMKCLGAMDGFIMLLYVLEAMFQGVAGSVIGVFLGLCIAFIRGYASFGGILFEAMPYFDMLIIAGLSFLTGILIAGLAATWPSWAAARLAPMEAMRVE